MDLDAAQGFGLVLYTQRINIGLSQSAIAATAGVAPSYYSEVENCKRLPPKPAIAVRLAQALKFDDEQVQRIAAMAVAERAASTLDASLEPGIRQLLLEIRAAAPMLRAEAIEHLRARLREVSM